MGIRAHVNKTKVKRFRRCPKCGKQIRVHQKRCRTCHQLLKLH